MGIMRQAAYCILRFGRATEVVIYYEAVMGLVAITPFKIHCHSSVRLAHTIVPRLQPRAIDTTITAGWVKILRGPVTLRLTRS